MRGRGGRAIRTLSFGQVAFCCWILYGFDCRALVRSTRSFGFPRNRLEDACVLGIGSKGKQSFLLGGQGAKQKGVCLAKFNKIRFGKPNLSPVCSRDLGAVYSYASSFSNALG